MPATIEVIAVICLLWYFFIVLVCTIGSVQLFRCYRRAPLPSISNHIPSSEVPHVTIIRPCKGREPYLYECLTSVLEQDYPRNKLTIYLCVATRDDIACHTIERILAAYSEHDVKLLVEEEDPALQAGSGTTGLGPNPKIRNMSRAYREAKGDLVWILDCNIWVGRGVCGRMVDKICGFSQQKTQPYKFVHHLPVAVDVPIDEAFKDQPLPTAQDRQQTGDSEFEPRSQRSAQHFGGRLDEAFLSSAHAKMYVAINTVAVAPCICGKSSMFRRSHLNALTNDDHSTATRFGSGIDYFSENICEDHLIGDLLWRAKIPSTMPIAAQKWRNHGLVFGDLALQPIAGMTIQNYVARRARWLRVRKFTVPLATLVEPGTESFLCSFIGALGLTTCSVTKSYVGSSWQALFLLWVLSICLWIMVDWIVYVLLQSGKTIEVPSPDSVALPPFARPLGIKPWQSRRPFLAWLKSWLGREVLTLPIWTWAIWGGVTVIWRDKKLWVGLDMKVHEVNEGKKNDQRMPLLSDRIEGAPQVNGSSPKVRQD